MLVEWNRMSREIDKDVAVPNGGSYGVQRIVRFAKALNFLHMRRAGQRAVKFVSPGVILALNSSSELAFSLLAQHGAAMSAHIVEGANIALVVACDDHAGIGDLADEIVTRLGNLAGASGTEPHIEMDGVHLALEPRRISIVALRQRTGFRDCNFRPCV